MTLSYQRYLAKSNLVKPLKQGRLENLSAIYSIINAIRWLAFEQNPISDVGANMLFQHIMSKLDGMYKLGDLGLFEIGMPEWPQMAKSTLRYAETKFGLRAEFKAITNVPSYTENTRKSLENGAVVLTRLSGQNRRYSVICAIDDYRCFLFDSGARHFIRSETLFDDSDLPILFKISVRKVT